MWISLASINSWSWPSLKILLHSNLSLAQSVEYRTSELWKALFFCEDEGGYYNFFQNTETRTRHTLEIGRTERKRYKWATKYNLRGDKALILVPSDCKSGQLQPLDLSSLTVLGKESLLWLISLDIFDTLFITLHVYVHIFFFFFL